jgi:CRISPR-associated protein Cst2
MHLFATILTPQAVASNNRGESDGAATLQKIYRNGDVYSTVSGEAIRYALREGWQADAANKLARTVSHHGSTWHEKEPPNLGECLDYDVLGFMHAKQETLSRRGVLEVSRAVSTTPWPGTISHHFASPRSNLAINTDDPVPYACEVHDTRYQYTIAMTPDGLLPEKYEDKYARTAVTLRGLQNLRRVGGCHARFLFDFSPEAIVLRWTHDPAPRIMSCFDQDDRGRVSLATLLKRVQGKDVTAKEMDSDSHIGGVIVGTALDIAELGQLAQAGVEVLPGVKAAIEKVLAQVKTHYDNRPAVVAAESPKTGKRRN